MPNYIIAYHGGEKPASPEEGAAGMARWKTWVADLGDAVVNPGTPLSKTQTVSASGVSDGGGANPIIGFTVVSTETMEQALEMAKQCPHLDMGGTLEVAEMIEM